MAWSADSIRITGDAIWWTADGAILLGDKTGNRALKTDKARRTIVVKKANRTAVIHGL